MKLNNVVMVKVLMNTKDGIGNRVVKTVKDYMTLLKKTI